MCAAWLAGIGVGGGVGCTGLGVGGCVGCAGLGEGGPGLGGGCAGFGVGIGTGGTLTKPDEMFVYLEGCRDGLPRLR